MVQGNWETARLIRMMVIAAALAATWIVMGGCSSSSNNKSDSTDAMSVSTSAKEGKAETGAAAEAKRDESVDVRHESAAADQAASKPENDSPASPVSSTPGLSLGDESAAINRKLIYKANVTMEVGNYGEAQTQINNLVVLSGGYVMQFSDTNTDYEKSGTFVIKVPSGGFMNFIAELKKLSPLTQQNIQGQDVTEEYVDLSSRLKAKQVVEERLLDFMEKTTKTDDLVKFSAELGRVQEEIEQIKGRMRYLDNNVAYSTVELRLYEKIGNKDPERTARPDDPLSDKAWKAMSASGKFLYRFLEMIVVVVSALLPVLIVAAVLAVPAAAIYRKVRNAHRKHVEREEAALRSESLSGREEANKRADTETDADADRNKND